MARHALVATLLLCPALAVAQSASDTKAAANSLFDEGKRLLASGDIDHACPKFAASLQLADQLGVRLNLADCHERQGRTASAWAEFREAASQADRRGDARAAYANQRAEALASRLVKLRLSVPTANQVPGLTVRRAGVTVPSDAFDSALPVDPGSYTIDALAPGYRTWSARVDAAKPGDIVTIAIPRLVEAPASPAPPKPVAARGPATAPTPAASLASTADREARSRRHRLGLAVGAAGAVATGAGVVLGLEARSKWKSVGSHCNASNVCDATGASINRSARLYGNVGTIAGAVGLAALIAGTVVYVTAPAVRSVAEHTTLELQTSGVQVGFRGRF